MKFVKFFMFIVSLIPFFFMGCMDQERGVDQSLHASENRMQQWNDWKFGMFIHWGAWSQTGIGYIWHITQEETPEEREKSFNLYKTFNPVNYDPKKWARIAKYAGMNYVVLTTKHHDGFCNFDTKLTELKVTNPECPYSKNPNPDLLKQFVKAYRDEGLAIGLYFSHIDWHHSAVRKFSVSHWEYDPSLIDKEPDLWKRTMEFEKGQIKELLTSYGDIDIFWFDIRWPSATENGMPYQHPRVREDITEIIKMMREMNPDLIINNRGVHTFGDFATPEQRIPAMGIPGYWESNITISNERGFWYKGENISYKTKKELIHMLIDIAAKGGNFLLNVGPRPDGTLTDQEIDRLKKVGEWMQVNGESIYGTTRTVFRHLDWGRCTVKGQTLYLHVLDWPEDGLLHVPGLKTDIKKAYLLTDKEKSLPVSRDELDVSVNVGKIVPDLVATVVVLDLTDKPLVDNRIRQYADGTVELRAGEAEIHGENATYYHGTGVRPGDYIENWTSTDDSLSWNFHIDSPGKFEVILTYGCPQKDAGSEFVIKVGSAVLTGKIRATTENNTLTRRKPELVKEKIGQVNLEKSGMYKLNLGAVMIPGEQVMSIRSIILQAI